MKGLIIPREAIRAYWSSIEPVINNSAEERDCSYIVWTPEHL